ncbi:unnamed protein product [Pylaiella littoralis]
MNPSRPPGGHNRNRKADPALAPSVPESEHTRKIPAPRGADNQGGACAKKAAEDDAEKEEPCCICYTQLPDVGRGIIPCGHVFCFYCIHKWSKKANVCPTCRLEFTKISKTMSLKDLTKEEARKMRDKKTKCTNKRQLSRIKRKASRVKNPMKGVYVKVFRVRKKTLKLTPAEQAALPHPQAPGGSLHVAGGPAVGAAVGVPPVVAAGAGGYFVASFTQLRAQSDRLQLEQAVARAREEAAEAQSRARAAWQQAVAARQQAVRAGKLAAEDEAREARDRTAAAAAAAAEQQQEEEEEAETAGRSLGVDGWKRVWREAVVNADPFFEMFDDEDISDDDYFSDDEDTPVMTDAESAWFDHGASVGRGEEDTQHAAAAAAASPLAAAAAVAGAAAPAAPESLNTCLHVASTVGVRTRDAFVGRFDAPVEQAEREREQRREEDRSRRLDAATEGQDDERERLRELKRERVQTQQQQDEVGQQWETMQRRGRERQDLWNTAEAEDEAAVEASVGAETEVASTPMSLLAQVGQQHGGFAALPGQSQSLPSSDLSPWISLASALATAAAGPTTPTAPPGVRGTAAVAAWLVDGSATDWGWGLSPDAPPS